MEVKRYESKVTKDHSEIYVKDLANIKHYYTYEIKTDNPEEMRILDALLAYMQHVSVDLAYTNSSLKEAADAVKKYCKSRSTCLDCPLANANVCGKYTPPKEWNNERIDEK